MHHSSDLNQDCTWMPIAPPNTNENLADAIASSNRSLCRFGSGSMTTFVYGDSDILSWRSALMYKTYMCCSGAYT